MVPRPRTTAFLVIFGVFALVAAVLLTTWPRLSDASDVVDRRWRGVQPRLDSRYDALAALSRAVRAEKAELGLLDDVDDALSAWKVETSKRPTPDLEGEPEAANVVEGTAARLTRYVAASPRLSTNQAVTSAVEAFRSSLPEEAVKAYNRAVRSNDRERDRFPGRFIAGLLGFEARPTLEIPR